MSLVPKRNSLLRRPQNSRCSPEAVTFSGDSGLGHSLARQCLASTPPALGLGLPVLDGGAVQVPPPLNQVPAPASSLSRAQTLGLPGVVSAASGQGRQTQRGAGRRPPPQGFFPLAHAAADSRGSASAGAGEGHTLVPGSICPAVSP